MRYLILTDIHGNWEALQAALAHASGRYDRILCGGDLVGYGANPNEIVEWAKGNVSVVVRGNHDKACAGLENLEWFNPVARAAAQWTQAALTPENRDYLRNLPKGPLAVEDFQILHGSPADEDEYMLTTADVRQVASYLRCPLSFFGHTHVQGGFLWRTDGARRIGKTPLDAEQHVIDIPADAYCLANPGSVGQPRDGDTRAGYLLYSTSEAALVFRRVPYDIETAQAKILAAGLPEVLARRLAMGA